MQPVEGAIPPTVFSRWIAVPFENYDGDSVRNIVNRLTAGGANGVQIEQSLEARNGFWKVIADAVASVYSEQLRLAS